MNNSNFEEVIGQRTDAAFSFGAMLTKKNNCCLLLLFVVIQISTKNNKIIYYYRNINMEGEWTITMVTIKEAVGADFIIILLCFELLL